MSKEVTFNTDARAKLMLGANVIAEAVRATLGAKGRNVMIGEGMYSARVTNDGVTVARSIDLDDPIENMGAYFLKEAASKTEEQAGDGTSTATILTQSMMREGMKFLAAGANPMDLKRGMHKASVAILKELENLSESVEPGSESVKHVATVSANNDKELGSLIAEAFSRVGKTGVVTAVESGNMDTEVNIVEGMELNRGYLDRSFCTNADKMTVEMEEPLILVTDYKIYSFKDLLPILDKINSKYRNRPTLIISDEIDPQVMPTIVMNHLQGRVNVACIKAPGYGDERQDTLEDIAIMTGGKVISESTGVKIEDATLDMLGEASKISISSEKTIIADGAGETEDIEDRMRFIKDSEEKEEDEYKKSKLSERLSKLAGGVGMISVGGFTDTEAEERKLRVDDAVAATKAAIDEGIVPGGGVALAIAKSRVKLDNLENRDEEFGADIVLSSLTEPLSQIITNAGKSVDLVLSKVVESNDGTGYNVNTDKFGNMIEEGIVDPSKVTKSALRNAVSISSMVITTEVIVSTKKED